MEKINKIASVAASWWTNNLNVCKDNVEEDYNRTFKLEDARDLFYNELKERIIYLLQRMNKVWISIGFDLGGFLNKLIYKYHVKKTYDDKLVYTRMEVSREDIKVNGEVLDLNYEGEDENED